jgi:hypothetical protein
MAKEPSKQTFNDLLPSETIALDADAFDTALRSYGVKMVHYRAMLCPLGLTDPEDIRRSHDHHGGCSNGYLYKRAGEITILFTGNGNSPQQLDAGLIDGSTVRVTLPTQYDDSEKPVHVAYADRFFLTEGEALVCDWHMFSAHETGIDRTQFPASQVEHIIDSDGREYDPTLYVVRDGNIHWLTQDRPRPQQVCVVWYLYQPFWYCSRILNEIRITQSIDPITMKREIRRLPYGCLLQRENTFRNEMNDPKGDHPNTMRHAESPESGGFGPR